MRVGIRKHLGMLGVHNSDPWLRWTRDQAVGEPGHLCERPEWGP